MSHSPRTHTGKKKPSRVLTTTVFIHHMHQSVEPSVEQDVCAVQQGTELQPIFFLTYLGLSGLPLVGCAESSRM